MLAAGQDIIAVKINYLKSYITNHRSLGIDSFELAKRIQFILNCHKVNHVKYVFTVTYD